MFRQTRYQTGELDKVIFEMKNGSIPLMDVDDSNEYEWVLDRLSEKGVYAVSGLSPDKNARDRVKEPDFEFRTAFSMKRASSETIYPNEIMYIDFYFEPLPEKDYDSIYGD